MRTTLHAILESIGTPRTILVYRQRARLALEAWEREAPDLGNYDAFKTWTARFHCHAEHTIRGITPPREVHMELDWACARHALILTDGPEAVEKALGVIRSGEQYRFYQTLQTIAYRLAEECARSEVESRVAHYLAGLSEEERIAIGCEYFKENAVWEDFHRHPPSKEGILNNLQGLLERHPFEMWKFEEADRLMG